MRYNIKTRMILYGILSVSFSIILAMCIVFFIIKSQSGRAAEKRIGQTINVVDGQLNKMRESLIVAAERLGNQEQVAGQIDFLQGDLSNDFVKEQGLEYIYEFTLVLGFKKTVVYDTKGKWLCAIIHDGKNVRLIHGSEEDSLLIKQAVIPLGNNLVDKDWKLTTDALPFDPIAPIALSEKAVFTYKAVNGRLWLEASAPIMLIDEFGQSMNKVGQIMVSDYVDTAFVAEISRSTGCWVNLFVGGELSAGILPSYKETGIEGDVVFEDAKIHGIDKMRTMSREITISGEDFFEGLFPVSDKFSKIGMLSILLSKKETQKNIKEMLGWLLLITIICVIGVIPVTWFFANSFVNPINRVVAGLKDIAEGEGDLTVRLDVSSEDEVGDLARWFNTFIGKLRDLIGDVAGHTEILNHSSDDLSSFSKSMSDGADEMSEKSNTVAGAAEEMNTNLTVITSALEQGTNNLKMVATSAEQMTATINEVAKSSEKARTITEDAVSKAMLASDRVVELGNAAEEIGKVTETITDISEQTNLLALNATIEAARAGDAGKGFAVVANEIKELARQTADATHDIKQKIDGIQNTTGRTVEDIEQISQVILNVSEIVTMIASSVEEQSAATSDIANNVSLAFEGTSRINENVSQSSSVSHEIAKDIAEVSQSAMEMANNSSQVKNSSEQLMTLSHQLGELVAKFKTNSSEKPVTEKSGSDNVHSSEPSLAAVASD